jgi:class 3 adenylate cyclase/tetratricopeptide (TPR) repeat protein
VTTCGACGEPLPATARFCPSCGTARAAACPACGAPALGRFCADCGASITAGPPESTAPPTPPSRLSERRITSVLFGDLVGFTTLSEARDAEEVRELLSRYFAAARTVIERYGGTVEKFIGDAVMAVWGVPTAHEDDAERAVRAGFDLIDAVTALSDETGLPGLTMRVGVVTGEVAVTVGATGEGMVAGDAVNTASRVQSSAEPGRVWVDDQTRELTAAAVVYDDRGWHTLKGKAEPQRLFEARQVVAAVGGARRVDGLEAPFCGRERELRLVKELFHATLEEGRPRLVTVYGAPGVGKSRLGWEFDKYTDGINVLVTMHRGRCLSYGDGVAFWALAEVVRGRLRILEGDPTETVVERLKQGLLDYVPDEDDRAWLLPRVATLLGVAEQVAAGSSFARDDLFGAWRTFLERVAGYNTSAGAVILLDDLQWADPALIDFITHVLDHAQAPIYMLALARSELADKAPALAQARRATALHLEPLPDPQMSSLVDGLVAGLPTELRDALVERSEGIPLYAVETVRGLIDRDAVVPKDGRYVLAPDAADRIDLADRSLPTSLHTLIASRLDGLPSDERSLVQDAAVLGLSFTADGLAALMSAVGDHADLDTALPSLVRKEIFSIDADPRSSENGQHRFVQVMVRTVAYETLSRRDRKARHLAVAEYLAQEPDADAIAAVRASHYLDARAAAGADDDASELAERAVELLELAAKQARVVGAPLEARRHLESALTLVADPTTVGRLTELAAQAALAAGAATDSAAMARRAQAAYSESGLPVDAARALALWGESLIYLGQSGTVLEPLSAAFEQLRDQPDAAEVAAALALGVARAYYIASGQNTLAIQWFDRAVVLAEELEDIPLLASTLASYAGSLILDGRSHMGLGLLQVSLDLARQSDDPKLELRPLNNLVSFLATRECALAREYAEAGLAIVRRIADRDWGHYLLTSSGHVYWNLGAWDEALVVLTEARQGSAEESSSTLGVSTAYVAAIEDARGTPTPLPEVAPTLADGHPDLMMDAGLFTVQAVAARRNGEAQKAAELSRRAFESCHKASGIDDDFPVFWLLAMDDQLAVGDFATARDMLATVGQAPRGRVPALQAAMLPWLRARINVVAGEMEQVDADLQAAATKLRQFGAPFYLARTLLDHAEWLHQQGQVAAAMPFAAEALELFTGLRAATWTRRAARLAGAELTPAAPAGT